MDLLLITSPGTCTYYVNKGSLSILYTTVASINIFY